MRSSPRRRSRCSPGRSSGSRRERARASRGPHRIRPARVSRRGSALRRGPPGRAPARELRGAARRCPRGPAAARRNDRASPRPARARRRSERTARPPERTMKITRIAAYQVDLPLHEGSYRWSGGKSVTIFDSTIVRVETDEGVVGHGEVCPLGPSYLPAYAAGVRAGIAELGPHLIGEDPTELGRLNRRMDAALKGHPYVKSGIDMACWDILGQAAGLPVCTLLGGRYGEDFVLYRAISQESPEEMAAKVAGYKSEGYRRFQLKVGGDPGVDVERIRAVRGVLAPDDVLVADANTGWLPHQAARV